MDPFEHHNSHNPDPSGQGSSHYDPAAYELGASPTIDPLTQGRQLFQAHVDATDQMILNEIGTEKIRARYQEMLEAQLLVQKPDDERDDTAIDSAQSGGRRQELKIHQASVNESGVTELLVTIQDSETGHYLYPTDIEPGRMIPVPPLDFCGLLVTVDEQPPSENGSGRCVIGVEPVMTSALFEFEVERFNKADCEGVIGNAVLNHLSTCYDLDPSIIEVQPAPIQKDGLRSFIAHDSDGEKLLIRLQRDPLGGVLGIQYVVPLRDCPHEIVRESASNHEGFVSDLTQVFQERGYSIFSAEDFPKAVRLLEFHLSRVLQQLFQSAWQKDNWRVNAAIVAQSPDGSHVDILTAIQDGQLNCYLPGKCSPYAAESEAFSGFLFRVRSSSLSKFKPLLQNLEDAVDPTRAAPLEIVFEVSSHGIVIPQELADKQLVLLQAAPGQSIFFHEIMGKIEEDAKARGLPRNGLTAQKIRVSFLPYSVFDQHCAVVVVEHSQGNHTVLFTQNKCAGFVSSQGGIEVHDFFPLRPNP